MTIRTAALSGESFPSRVTRIGTVLDAGSRTMRAEIELSNPGHRLRPGMMARVEVQLAAVTGAVTVPVSALRIESGDRLVFVENDGRVSRRPVRTGLESAERLQIVDGLRSGERVVLSSSETLRDGMEVRVQ